MPILIAFVLDGLNLKEREAATSRASDLLKDYSRSFILRVYDFNELKEKYGFTMRGT